jgi:maltose/moltooligosaccharide transporter
MDEKKRFGPGFFTLLSLPATAMGFALSVQISALSWILITQLGLSNERMGQVWAAGPIAGILAQVVIGFISDRVWFWNGRRRPFILIGGFTATLMLLALPNISKIAAFFHTDVFPVAACVALVLDLAINLGFNPTRSIIADVTPEGKVRTQGFTWMQTVSGTFGVLAYAVAVTWNNYALIYTGVVLVFCFAMFPPLFIKEPRELNVAADPGAEIAPAGPSQTGEMLKIYVAHAFTWFGVQTMFVYMVPFLKWKIGSTLHLSDDQIGQTQAGAFLVLNLVAALLPALGLEPMARSLGRVRTHALCLFVMAAGYLGIATIGTTPAMLYALMAVAGVGWAATVSLPFAIFSEKVDRAKMGTYMGIFNLSVVLPQLLVSLKLGKIVDDAADKNIIFFICAASLAISSVLWLFVKEQRGASTPSAIGGGGHH